jgi:hypothetical protein
MKKIIPVSLIIIFTGSILYSTAQFPDIIIYNGKEYALMSNPLESYFGTNHPRPKNLFKFSCTANWRGYIAKWKIDNGKLYLMKVMSGDCSANPAEIDVSSIFLQKLPVEATWFNGILRIPRGKLLSYVHMGYGSVYEEDLILTISSGKLIHEEIKKNTQKENIESIKGNPN